MPRTRSRLYRRKDSPYWWAVYTAPDGADVVGSTGCRDRSAATTWLAARELERARADAGIPTAREISLVRATAEYLAQREKEWSSGWYDAVEAFVRLQVVPHFGAGRTVSTITRADVEAFRSTQIGRRKLIHTANGLKEGAPISDATVNRLMAALAAWGAWCLTSGRGYHLENPWAKHQPLPEDQAPVPVLEDEQLAKVLASLEDPTGPLPSHGRRKYRAPWRAIVEFARETGLRRGELGKIARADVQGETLWLVSTKKRGRTKSRKMRAVVLSPLALDILAKLPKREDGLVFGPIPDARRAFRAAAAAGGLDRVWMHLFRHAFASRLAERGAGNHELRDAGGWSSSRMADRYTHARLDRLRQLVSGNGPATLAPETAAGGPEEPGTARKSV